MKLKLLLSIAIISLLATQSVTAETVPLETFFKKPQFAGFQLSPNGKELAALAPVNGRMNLVILDLATRTPRAVTGVSDLPLLVFGGRFTLRVIEIDLCVAPDRLEPGRGLILDTLTPYLFPAPIVFHYLRWFLDWGRF